jgi:DNA replication protein DnaC
MINQGSFQGRKLKDPDDKRLNPASCRLARLPRKLWKTEWRYYPNDYEPKKLLLQYVEDLDKHRCDGKGLLLVGRTRKGKTCASSLIVKEIIRRDGYPLFVSAHHIPAIEMSDEEEDIELSRKMRNITFLFIDDLGAGSGRGRSCSMIERIVRDRDAEMLPTIVSTNLNDALLVKHFGEPFKELLEEITIGVFFK